MRGATEYRDTWRGLRILVPAGWQVARSGAGLFLHDATGERAIALQPRPGAASPAALERVLLEWLKRFDPQAELHAEPDGPAETRVCTVSARTCPQEEAIGVFALQMRPGGGFISGFLAPASTYEADSRTALESLATLEAVPALGRSPWRDPAEGASSALVPRGWRAEGGASRSNPAGIAAARFQAWADASTSVMSSQESKLLMEPGLLSGILASISRGAVGQGRFVDAAGYVEAHLLPALRQEAPAARVEAVLPRPDLIPMALAQEAATSGLGPQEILQAGLNVADAVLSFHAGGLAMRQLTRVATMRVPSAMSRGLPLWMATLPYTCRAPADRFEEWQPVLEGVGLSFQVDPEWQRAQRARIARQVGRDLPQGCPAVDPGALLAEAERLVCERSGRPFAIHERPFLPAPGEDGVVHPAGLYEQSLWRGVEARV